MSKPAYHVTVALVYRQDRWLVARRPPDVHLGGLWEFPGGKREPGETPSQTALRELREECGVQALAQRTLEPLTHDYGDRSVRITPVICRWQAGEPQALASEECRWVTAAELRALKMPAVNERILRAVADARRQSPARSSVWPLDG